MQKRLFTLSIVLLLILLSILLITSPSSPVVAYSTHQAIPTDTPTPDANAILNQANAVATQAVDASAHADREANEIQSVINIINIIVVLFTAALAIIGVAGGIVGVRSFRDIEEKGNARLEKVSEIADEIENKKQEIDALQSTLAQESENTNRAISYLVLGNQLWEQRKRDQAIDLYIKARKLRQHDPQINYALGRAYTGVGRYEQAIEYLTLAVKEDTEFAQAHLQLGIATRSQADQTYEKTRDEEQRDEDYREVINHLKRATDLQPNYDDALGALGGTYRRLKKYQLSLKYYRQALNANPQSSYARGNVALLAWHEGDLDTAREAFKQTEEIATERINTHMSEELYWDFYDRAMARLALGQKETALKDYRTAIELTRTQRDFQSVLDGLQFLKEVEQQYPMDGLDEVIVLVRRGKEELETPPTASV
ncbi:MAG: tetratricopeptide repeat protein [Ktedonobacteraceae bacterium]|nr:tetratricopeptide repeat protein [Ktedonobacteraceae bacterium]